MRKHKTSVTVTWSANGKDSYMVYYGTVLGTWSTALDAGTASRKLVTGLTVGRQYYFALTARNSMGESKKSAVVAYKPLAMADNIVELAMGSK